ncbi:MAG TPA: SRPBCC domain-containing protein [Verrucomicrobiae bacterium]|nr:SRPBCC domain-containing protein [Verrucomicrobiae bacterium]
MKLENKTGHALVLKRTFAAPRELVFKAWTTAAMVKNWWGCNEFPASHMEMDARPGGNWRGCLRADDGGEIWLGGRFIEIVRPERLVFTFVREPAPGLGIEPVDTMVTLVFSESGGKTVMDFRQEFFSTSELRDSHHNGWTTGFDRLDKILGGTHQPTPT